MSILNPEPGEFSGKIKETKKRLESIEEKEQANPLLELPPIVPGDFDCDGLTTGIQAAQAGQAAQAQQQQTVNAPALPIPTFPILKPWSSGPKTDHQYPPRQPLHGTGALEQIRQIMNGSPCTYPTCDCQPGICPKDPHMWLTPTGERLIMGD